MVTATVVWAPSIGARADNRPTSGDASVLSGRTLGDQQTVLSGGVGWPGIFAQVTFAPSSTFNVGARFDLLYGSPLVGFASGIGTELSAPMRVHVFGRGEWDLALRLRPCILLGHGAVAGVHKGSIFDDNFGWAALAEVGLLAGWHPNDELTLALGLLSSWGVARSPDAGATVFAGNILGMTGLEYLLRRDTMLFVEVEAGGGFTGGAPFADGGVLRTFLGAAYVF